MGEKVDPDEVEAALRDHPAVIDVVAVSHRTLAAYCGRRLAGLEFPKQFLFADQVPRSAAGEIRRWRLASFHENGAAPP